MDKIPMTAAGHTVLERELKHLQQVERPRIIQQISDARTHGDLSENAEYHAAKEQQAHNETRIAEIEDKLARRPDAYRSLRRSPARWSARRKEPRSRSSPRAAPRPMRFSRSNGDRISDRPTKSGSSGTIGTVFQRQ